jgi:hypothetical protein
VREHVSAVGADHVVGKADVDCLRTVGRADRRDLVVRQLLCVRASGIAEEGDRSDVIGNLRRYVVGCHILVFGQLATMFWTWAPASPAPAIVLGGYSQGAGVVDQIMDPVQLAATVNGFHLEPRCRVCRNDHLRKKVNDMLASGVSYAMILRALRDDNAKLAKAERVTIDSVRNHTARHFPVQNVAKATVMGRWSPPGETQPT